MNRRNFVFLLGCIMVFMLCSSISRAADTGLVGSYFDNKDFTNRKLVRVDPQVDFNWGNGSPAPEIGADTFSVRWEGQVETLGAGDYTFYTSSDDGVRFWVNGVLLIDNWTDHAPTQNAGTITLEAHQRYSIRMEMYENGGGAVAVLKWAVPGSAMEVIPASQLHQPAWYVNPPEVTGTVPANGGSLSVVNPGISVTFSKPMDKASVEAAFTMGDVAGRFAWSNETLTFTPISPLLQNANHTVTIGAGAMDFLGNAMAAPYSFTLTTGAYQGFVGQYFDQKNLTEPKLVRIDPKIDFNWGTGSPSSIIGPDTFSVRWTGQIVPRYTEAYTLSTVSDDGIRLWVDGVLKIDNWTDHAAKEDTCTMDLVAGQAYDVRVEYYENGGNTQAKLSWASTSQAKEVIPADRVVARTDLALPSVPEDLHLTHLADRVAVLAWQAPSDGSGVSGYELFRDGKYLASTNEQTYRDAGLTPETAYRYAVRSVGVVGGVSPLTGELLAMTLPAAAKGMGTGLLAKIYDNPDFTDRKLARVDPVLDFNWGTGAPATGVGADTFSIRWQGQIQPQYSEQYTIYTVSDDGVRVWVDGQLVIDNWTDHGAREDKGTITLQAGQKYDIRMDYYENGGNTRLALLWESLSQPKEVVATTQLYPAEFLASLDVKLLTSLESPVSPAWVEGKCSEDAATIRFSANGGAEQDVVRENSEQWYADTATAQGLPYGIPLNKDNPTALQVAAQNGAGEAKQTGFSLIWKPTKLNDKSWSNDEIVIRVNDSLLFTVQDTAPGNGNGNKNGIVKIDADGNGTVDYHGEPDGRFPWKYTAPGHYTVTAWLRGKECGTLTVTVVAANLHAPMACEIGFQRQKFVEVYPLDSAEKVSFGGNDAALLGVSVKGRAVDTGVEGLMLYVTALQRGTPILQARVNGKFGPLVRQAVVDEFTIDTRATTNVLVNDSNGVGTSEIRLIPYVPNIRLEFVMFAHRATFRGGVTAFSVNSSDVDPATGKPLFRVARDEATGEDVGSYRFDIEVPEGESSYCFRTKAYQSSSDEQEICRGIPSNGDICKARIPVIRVFVGEKAELTIIRTQSRTRGEKHSVHIETELLQPCFMAPVSPEAEISKDGVMIADWFDCGKNAPQTFTAMVAANQPEPSVSVWGEYSVTIQWTLFENVIKVNDVEFEMKKPSIWALNPPAKTRWEACGRIVGPPGVADIPIEYTVEAAPGGLKPKAITPKSGVEKITYEWKTYTFEAELQGIESVIPDAADLRFSARHKSIDAHLVNIIDVKGPRVLPPNSKGTYSAIYTHSTVPAEDPKLDYALSPVYDTGHYTERFLYDGTPNRALEMTTDGSFTGIDQFQIMSILNHWPKIHEGIRTEPLP
jgi:hypothetical protein